MCLLGSAGRSRGPIRSGRPDPLCRILMRRRREVSLLGAGRQAWPGDANDDAAPRPVALRVPRRIANRVLARELVGDLSVDARQFRELVGEERAGACLLRELTQDELGFLESLGRRSRTVRSAQAD